jgi:hypothetical protein
MKSLEEKKLLVKMARMLGEPVDQELLESIKREEQLAEAFSSTGSPIAGGSGAGGSGIVILKLY